MHKTLAVLTIFLAILSYSEATTGQNITSTTRPGDAIVAANGSDASLKTKDTKDVSPQDSAEAKRLYKEAVKYRRGGLSKQASQLYEKAVQLNPNYADAHYDLGYAYFDQGRWEDAVRSFETAIRINPKDKKTRVGLDEARVLAGRNTEPAQHSEEKVAAADPISTRAWAESRSRNVTQVGTSARVKPVSATPSVAPSTTTPSVALSSTTPSVAPSSTSPSVAPSSTSPSVAPSSTTPSVAPSTTTPSVAPSTTTPSVALSSTTPSVAPSSTTPSVAPSSTTPSVAPSTTTPSAKAPSAPASVSVPTAALSDSSSSASTAEHDLTSIYHIGIGDVLDVRLGNEATTQSTLFTRHSLWTT